ncbi:MAG: SulP family inorganic anion transporter [Deltaproteobacteria bacterium]|nr:MAG: SulP family inorganic anion transporter [Deltaproteobacteria bacterium]
MPNTRQDDLSGAERLPDNTFRAERVPPATGAEPSTVRRRLGRPDPGDYLASVVVFLVALPLCMGIAVACGVPPALGIVTGIVGGLVVGFLQGAPLQVSGPAAGLVVLVVEAIDEHGLEYFGWVVAIAGAIQLVGGLLGAGRYFRAVPPSVIHGMLAGIGVLIFASQVHVMIDDAPRKGGLANLLALPEAVAKAVAPSESLPHREAAAIGIATIVLIVSWQRFGPAKVRKFLPAPLFGIVCTTVIAQVFALPIEYVDVPSDLAAALNVPVLPASSQWWGLFMSGVVIAAVASAETMLCTTAVDRMHGGEKADYNREMLAQGIGNLICGAVGALPMTGVIVRSSANVQAGAKTRWSAILHGLWLLVFVGVFSQLLTHIPVSALAALLVFIGARLANPAVVKELRRYGRGVVIVFLVTVGTIVATDLLTGVITGFVLAAGRLLLQLARLHIEVVDDPASKRTVLRLVGSATFLRLADIADALQSIPDDREIHVDVDRLDHIDHAILELFRDWADQHKARGGRIVFDWEYLERRYHFGHHGAEAGNEGEPAGSGG